MNNNPLLASQYHKFTIILLVMLLSCLSVTSLWAKGEATAIYSSSGNAAVQAQYTESGQLYNWGQGLDGQGTNGNLFIDGFDAGGNTYNYQDVAGDVRIMRRGTDVPCGLFAEVVGSDNYSFKPNFPGDPDGKNCDIAKVMGGRVINVGALDVFNNIGAQAKNIERIDFVFIDGIKVTAQTLDATGHVATEKSGNNPIQIAAITGISPEGNPTEYGSLVTVYPGHNNASCPDPVTDICYGIPAGTRTNTFLHTDNAVTTPPTRINTISENMGLAFISQADLGLVAGATYYGFSYFSTDVDPDNQNNNPVHVLTDHTTFPDDTSRLGGATSPGDADIFGGTAGYFVLDSLVKSVSGDVVGADANGIAGITVSLYRDDGETANEYDATDTLLESLETDPNGDYSFSRVMPDTYIIRVDSSDTDLTTPGYTTNTESLMVTVTDSDLASQRFNFALPQITGNVFNDVNSDGIRGAGEGVSGVTVGLYNDLNMLSQVGSDGSTDANGAFTFSDVVNGAYFLFVDQSSSQDLNELVPNNTTNPLPVTVQNGSDVTASFPFVTVSPATYLLTGTVFQDEDGDGLLAGSGESGVNGVTVTLFDNNMGQKGTTDTASDGTYTFSSVVAGDYTVQIDLDDKPVGYAISQSDNPGSITLGANETETVNFPFGVDTDGDGIPDRDDIDDDNDGILDSVEQNGANDVDIDADGIWDRLDLDSDNDGILDVVESGGSAITAMTIESGRISGAVGANGLPDSVEDGSETGNVGYALLDTDDDTKPDFRDLDSDNDGISDAIEGGSIDPDGNGFIGSGDPLTLASNEVNSDGIPLLNDSAVISTPSNTDGDPVPDYRDLDSDNDGISDVVEAGGTDDEPDGRIGAGSPPAITSLGIPVVGLLLNPTDTDNDGTADFLELDSDKDGIKDIAEAGYADSNNDGMVDDFTDPDSDGAGNPLGFTPVTSFPDVDFDGIPDYQDKVSTPPQLDTGLDGMGCTLGNNRSVDPMFPLLIVLSFLYLMRGYFLKRRNKGRKGKPDAKVVSVMLVGVILIFPVTLSAYDKTEFQSRWYGGLGIGISELEPDPNSTSFTIDETRSKGGKLFIGYDLFKRLSLEAYYSDVGEAKVGSTYPGIPGGTIGYKDYGISALYYALKQHEAHEGFGLFGRVGLGKMKNDTELPYQRLNDNHAMLGAGLEYAFRNGFALRAELDYYDTDSRLFALSLLKRFGGNKQEKIVPEPEPEPISEPVIALAPVPVVAAPVVVEPENVPAPVPIVKAPELGELGIVYFDTDSSLLTATAHKTLDNVAAELLRVPQTKVTVQGYTDSRASNTYNQLLSEKRVHAVIRYLNNKGISSERLKPIAFGEANPVANNKNTEGYRLNRRVEFRVSEK